jgi:hypothetical protein
MSRTSIIRSLSRVTLNASSSFRAIATTSSRISQITRHLSTMSLPETVQAIGINKTGDLEVLEKLTVPFPKQAPDQLIVKVTTAVVLRVGLCIERSGRSFGEV